MIPPRVERQPGEVLQGSQRHSNYCVPIPLRETVCIVHGTVGAHCERTATKPTRNEKIWPSTATQRGKDEGRERNLPGTGGRGEVPVVSFEARHLVNSDNGVMVLYPCPAACSVLSSCDGGLVGIAQAYSVVTLKSNYHSDHNIRYVWFSYQSPGGYYR